MSNPEAIPQAGPRRSLRAYWTPLLFLAAAVTIPTMAALRAMDSEHSESESEVAATVPRWMSLPFMTVALIGAAFVSEKSARKQLALARVGQMADGTIDAVRRYRPTKKRSATWSFAAADG